MDTSRERRSAIMEVAPWVFLLIACLSATRMAPGPLRDILLVTGTGLFLAYLPASVSGTASCPRCDSPELQRLARHPRYARCAKCGARCRRRGWGPWRLVSGPGAEAYFRPRTDAGRWLDAPFPDADETTCGTLLRAKRLRDRSLWEILRDRHKPWPGPLATAPAKPPPAETTCGRLLRTKALRARARGEPRRDEPVPPPLDDPWLDH